MRGEQACAGSSCPPRRARTGWRDHPRVRGEQSLRRDSPGRQRGSPPRARGAVQVGDPVPVLRRITPACAGSRPCRADSGQRRPDHPRVRGEQCWPPTRTRAPPGSPPRARGAVLAAHPDARSARITPACAGSRVHPEALRGDGLDHPRVRGEQSPTCHARSPACGSPPRARGAAFPGVHRGRNDGITPACAGSRLPDLRRYRSTPPFSFTRPARSSHLVLAEGVCPRA